MYSGIQIFEPSFFFEPLDDSKLVSLLQSNTVILPLISRTFCCFEPILFALEVRKIGIPLFHCSVSFFFREPLLKGSGQEEQESQPSTPLLDMGPWSIMVGHPLNTIRMVAYKFQVNQERYDSQ